LGIIAFLNIVYEKVEDKNKEGIDG